MVEVGSFIIKRFMYILSLYRTALCMVVELQPGTLENMFDSIFWLEIA